MKNNTLPKENPTCHVCWKYFKGSPKIHIKEHKEKEKGIFLLSKNTRIPQIYLYLLKNPGEISYKLKELFGSGINSFLKIMEDNNLITRIEEKVNGRTFKYNYPNVKILIDFVCRYWFDTSVEEVETRYGKEAIKTFEGLYNEIYSNKNIRKTISMFLPYPLNRLMTDEKKDKIFTQLILDVINIYYFMKRGYQDLELVVNILQSKKREKILEELQKIKKNRERRNLEEAIINVKELLIDLKKLKESLEKGDTEKYKRKWQVLAEKFPKLFPDWYN